MSSTFEIFLHYQGWMYLLILTVLEIVLGIDNIIFISIVTDPLEKLTRRKARLIGLSLALIVRLVLLCFVSLIIQMKTPLIEMWDIKLSGQDMILLGGGLFLIYKSTIEMHKSVTGKHDEDMKKKQTLSGVILQIVIIDFVFSFDSIITAIGMTNGIQQDLHANPLPLIFLSVIIAMIVMLMFAGRISDFINSHPTIKTIALSFLVTIGVLLVAEAFGQHIPKGYIYFALVYSLIVELINIRVSKHEKPPKTE